MAGTEYLGREQILEADDVVYEDFPCPEWGGVVRARVMLTGAERQKVTRILSSVKAGTPTLRETALAALPETIFSLVVVDAAGERVFSDEDVRALAGKSSAPIIRVYKRVLENSGMGPDALELAAGNSEATQSEPSISD